MHLLLVEDDEQLGKALHTSLQREGFVVSHASTGTQALQFLQQAAIDGVVLDLGLPDMDGTTVLADIRARNRELPVLVLTARNTVDDKVAALDIGADDYLTKPFDVHELFARLRVIERRLNSARSSTIKLGEVCLDSASHSLVISSTPVDVVRREFMVLQALMENAGRVMSRGQLESKLYEWGEEVQSNAIEVHIHHLRKKLPSGFIQTVRGVGYVVRKV